jgi:hypothetical protein
MTGIRCAALLATALTASLWSGTSSAEGWAKGAGRWDIFRICDLREGAPIGERCYGYVAATVEAVYLDAFEHASERRRACIPPDESIEQIIARIRPRLREMGLCYGACTSQSFLRMSLYQAYPCPAEPAPGSSP